MIIWTIDTLKHRIFYEYFHQINAGNTTAKVSGHFPISL